MKKLFEFIMAMVYACGAALAVSFTVALFVEIVFNAK